jgi:hypothetical protein
MGGTMMPTLTWKAVVLLIISARVLQVVGKAIDAAKAIEVGKIRTWLCRKCRPHADSVATSQILSLKSDLFSFANVLKIG